MTHIEFIDPPDHINKYLTHWTGREKDDEQAFDILSRILSARELKFSSNQTSFPDPNQKTSNMMICFTDTPIRQSLEHCKRYGYFGISFNKQQLILYGANPVLYLTENRRNNQDFFNNLYFQKNDESILIDWFGSVMQPYNTNPNASDHYPEFYEREWRIAGRVLPYLWLPVAEQSQGKYKEYPFKGEIRRQKKQEDINDSDFFLKFDLQIIENIIVPINYEQKAIDFIKQNNLDIELILVTKKQ